MNLIRGAGVGPGAPLVPHCRAAGTVVCRRLPGPEFTVAEPDYSRRRSRLGEPRQARTCRVRCVHLVTDSRLELPQPFIQSYILKCTWRASFYGSLYLVFLVVIECRSPKAVVKPWLPGSQVLKFIQARAQRSLTQGSDGVIQSCPCFT